MTLSDLTKQAGEWLRVSGPMHDVVISSRVRLARNIAGMPFLAKCSPQQIADLADRLRDEILDAGLAKGIFYVDVDAASQLDRQLLVERHLISRQLAEGTHARGVAISDTESFALMINEEDHLRMQVLRSGMQLHEAFDEIQRIDDTLEQRLDFAYHNRFGYLSACPTNVGTGMRVSVMLHLPALKLTGEIEKALRAGRDMRLAVRGLYGEGSDAIGDLFQLSNQVTLGKSEEQIIDEFLNVIVPQYLSYERTAREVLVEKHSLEIDDKICRALAILRSARWMNSEEMLFLLSMVRLGINLGRVTDVDLQTINELFLLGQPAHLQRIHKTTMTAPERAERRATFLRTRLGGH